MKRALATLALAVLVAGGLTLSLNGGRRSGDDRFTPGFTPGHGDYPARTPTAAGSELSPQKLACLTPDLRKPRHRIG